MSNIVWSRAAGSDTAMTDGCQGERAEGGGKGGINIEDNHKQIHNKQSLCRYHSFIAELARIPMSGGIITMLKLIGRGIRFIDILQLLG